MECGWCMHGCCATLPIMPTTVTIDPSITMGRLLEQYPGAQRALFRKYHIGGCASCGFQLGETLANVCERNDNIPVREAIEQILTSHEQEQAMMISPSELAAQRSNGLPLKLIDIRTREEYEAVNIEGSTLFTQELMQEALLKWDRSQPVVIVDHQGTRAVDAASYFIGHEFRDVRALRGGIDAWSVEVDPDLPRYHLE
jgi:rhodanese-related sulfurtransferase